MELAKAIHPNTYLSSGLDMKERLWPVRGRKESCETLHLILSRLRAPSSVDFEEYRWRFLAYQAHAVILARRCPDTEYPHGARNGTRDDVLDIADDL